MKNPKQNLSRLILTLAVVLLAFVANLALAGDNHDSEIGGVWFTTGDYTSGTGSLGRIDLATGEIHRNLRTTGADTKIFTDGDSGLLLLTRFGADSVTALSGKNAEEVGHFKLAPFANHG